MRLVEQRVVRNRSVFVLRRVVVAVVLAMAAGTISTSVCRASSSARPLEPGARVEGRFSNTTAHTFTINLKHGQYFRLNLEALGTGVNVLLTDNSGNKLLAFDCRHRRHIPISAIAGRTGAYSLTLKSKDSNPRGGFVLEFLRLKTANPYDRKRLSAEKSFLQAEQLASTWSPAAWREAVAKYEHARLSWKELDEKRDELNALKSLGALSYALNDPTKALGCYDAAKSLAELTGDRRGLSEILTANGYIYLTSGEISRALDNARFAEKSAREVSSDYDEANALDLLGEAYLGLGNIQESLTSHQRSLSIWQRLSDENGQALALLHLGEAYSDASETQKAFDSHNKALSLWRASENPRGEGRTLIALGHLHSKTGDKQMALNMYRDATKVLEPLDDKAALAMISNGIGYVLEELGQTKNALQRFLRALELFREVGHRLGEVGTLYKIGKTHFALGNKVESLKYYDQSRLLSNAIGAKRTEAVSTALIGEVHLSMGNPQSALKYYEDAALLNEQGEDFRELAYTCSRIAAIHQQLGNHEKAEEYFNKSFALNRRTNDRFGESGTLFNIAKSLKETGKLDEAKIQIEAALRITESLRINVASQDLRSSYVDSIHQQFELYIDVLMQLHKQSPTAGWNAAALAASERSRARSLLEMLAESDAELGEGVDPKLLAQEKAMRAELDELAAKQLSGGRKHSASEREAIKNQIARLTADHMEVEGQIRAKSSSKSVATPSLLKASEMQALLDSETVMLEFALGDERSFAWVVTLNSIDSYELPARVEIENATREVYEALTARNLEQPNESSSKRRTRIGQADANYAAKSKALSEMLLAQATPLIKNKRLVVIADGILQYLSFAALPVPGESDRTLLMDHEIVNLPSASVFATQRQLLREREPAPLGMAVFADPVFDAQDSRVSTSTRRKSQPANESNGQTEARRALRDVGINDDGTIPRLPFSRREANAIVAVSGSIRPLQALDFEANRVLASHENLSKYRYLHFATHGLVNSEHPELSGILLSMVDEQGKPQNGFLKLTEISRLNLRAELIVLSACQTALGKEMRGEGLLSLTRGFMNAGAARVIASLWKVDDAATAELMAKFYEELLTKKKTPAAALKAAQLHLSQQDVWRSPYYWGAFVLQGEWR